METTRKPIEIERIKDDVWNNMILDYPFALEDAVKYAMVISTITTDPKVAKYCGIPEYLCLFNDKYKTPESFPEYPTWEEAQDIWNHTRDGFTDWVQPAIKLVLHCNTETFRQPKPTAEKIRKCPNISEKLVRHLYDINMLADKP